MLNDDSIFVMIDSSACSSFIVIKCQQLSFSFLGVNASMSCDFQQEDACGYTVTSAWFTGLEVVRGRKKMENGNYLLSGTIGPCASSHVMP